MTRRYFWGLLFTLAVLSAAALEAADELLKDGSLRVMSFNIRYNNRGDGPNAWPLRRETVSGMFEKYKIDAAGLQEVLQSQMVDLEKSLPQFGWVGVGRDDGKENGEFSPIFFRRDRLDVIESGTFWLSPTPEKIGSKGWDAALPRIATWTKFKDKQTGVVWYLFNTHFDHLGAKAREESAKLLRERICKVATTLPVVLTGDLNTREASAPYEVLTGKREDDGWHLKDARYASKTPHFGLTTTWNGFNAPVADEKIDFVMVAGPVRVLKHGVLDDRIDGRFASDHFAVLAEVEMPAVPPENGSK